VDCSGFTQAVALALGDSIARTSEEQWATLPPGGGAVGDLVFFDVPSDTQAQPAHVGIVSSPGVMLNAPYTGTVVRYDTINGPGRTLMGYRSLPGLSAPPSPPSEDDVPPFLVIYEGSYWVVAGDWGHATRVATPSDGTVAYTDQGMKIQVLSAAQMATIVAQS
jgi:NlpC/P60 family